MKQKSMTALVSAFSRAYHAENSSPKIFHDTIAKQLLTDEEVQQISKNMVGGIDFFNPSFTGTPETALRWIVDNQLSPSPLGRAAFAEKALEIAVRIGARQYLIMGAGYDTFAYRQPDWATELQIFELDHPAMLEDKLSRLEFAKITIAENVHYVPADFTEENWKSALLKNTIFDTAKIGFCSILGVAYYLPKETFARLLYTLNSVLPTGSSIIFDYPDENSFTDKAGDRAKKQAMMTGTSNEKMLASYSYDEVEWILSTHSFLIYEHLTPVEITAQYFNVYNNANPDHIMTAFDNVNYCLAVKK